jgi:hypothetical protein
VFITAQRVLFNGWTANRTLSATAAESMMRDRSVSGTTEMSRKTKIILIVLAATVALVLALILVPPAIVKHKTKQAIHDDWARLEEICKNKSWSQLDEHGWGILVRFKDGDYVALRYYDDHGEGDFLHPDDYTLGISGKGKKIYCEYHFCGGEGLSCRMSHDEYLDLADFLKRTADCNWVDIVTEPVQ